uniref:Uncharacterized protein n=1 Tax=Glossina palpalis gambiensis TaxID=67801 RepID=A0A1B0BUK9_9MUSC
MLHFSSNDLRRRFKRVTSSGAPFRLNEQQQLQQTIKEILEENHEINSKLEILKSSHCTGPGGNDSRDDATREKLTNDAYKNVRKQIDYLQTENNDLRLLHKNSQKTIENLEKEIQNYRNQLFKPTSVCEVKHKYTTALKLLECTIANQKTELKEKACVIESLFDERKNLRNQVEKLEKCLEEKDKQLEKMPQTLESLNKLQDQLKEITKHNNDLQSALKQSKIAIEERFNREQNALQKVQEALAIAEAAVVDKDDALKRERILKEECDNIASTIGQVMDEAARKVEKDMETMRRKYVEKEKVLLAEKNKLLEEIQNQKKFNQILDTRCNRFEQKYKETMKDNDHLSQQLELAAKTLYEMEQRINLNENTSPNDCEERNKKIMANQDQELRHYIEINKQLKEKYRVALNEMTNDFKQEIYRLQSEVAAVKAENEMLKLQQDFENGESEEVEKP